MPDTNAFARSKTLRQNINRYTGYNDKTVTDGVKRLIRDGGNESYKPLEAAMLLDEFPNPIITRKEFSRLMDYGDSKLMELYSVYKQVVTRIAIVVSSFNTIAIPITTIFNSCKWCRYTTYEVSFYITIIKISLST